MFSSPTSGKKKRRRRKPGRRKASRGSSSSRSASKSSSSSRRTGGRGRRQPGASRGASSRPSKRSPIATSPMNSINPDSPTYDPFALPKKTFFPQPPKREIVTPDPVDSGSSDSPKALVRKCALVTKWFRAGSVPELREMLLRELRERAEQPAPPAASEDGDGEAVAEGEDGPAPKKGVVIPKACPICLDEFEGDDGDELPFEIPGGGDLVAICDVREPHVFHVGCLVRCYDKKANSIKCPVPSCGQHYGRVMGPMPDGKMSIWLQSHQECPLSGYGDDVGTISIQYSYPGGVQRAELNHPHPGVSHGSTSRTCYLPDNQMGRRVLVKLKEAFRRRMTFRVGRSVTTGKDNQVVWNGIHHKTNTSGGFSSFGYPDPSYFQRVLSELWAKGIR